MKNSLLLLTLILFFTSCNILKSGGGKSVKLKTETDKFSYALGLSVGENLKQAGLDTINMEALARGIEDQLKNREILISQDEAAQIVQRYLFNLEERKTQTNKLAEKKFLEENKKRPGVTALESGLQYEIIKRGDGPKPTIVDNVTVHYHGTLLDGQIFDSSIEREEPMTFPVNSVIPGMQEALLLMPKGSKWRIYIPSALAYGETGAGDVIDPYSLLIFDVELLDIQ